MIPEYMKEALDRYVNQKIMPGSFLQAVLCNDLFGAMGRADSNNRAALYSIVQYIYNELPSNSWGSAKIVKEFLGDKDA